MSKFPSLVSQVKTLSGRTNFVSFDVGYKHISHAFISCNVDKVRQIKATHKKLIQMKRVDRNVSEYKELVVDPLFGRLHIAYLTNESVSEKYNVHITRLEVIKYLERFERQWKKAHVIIIEQQLSGGSKFGAGTNVKAIRIEETIWSYFYHRYPEAQLYIYNSKTKTTKLGAGMELANNKPSRKAWTIAFFEAEMRRMNHKHLVPLLDLKNSVRGKRKSDELATEIRAKVKDMPYYIRQLAERVVIERVKLEELADVTCQLVAFLIHHA